jgi:hypothetical protein
MIYTNLKTSESHRASDLHTFVPVRRRPTLRGLGYAGRAIIVIYIGLDAVIFPMFRPASRWLGGRTFVNAAQRGVGRLPAYVILGLLALPSLLSLEALQDGLGFAFARNKKWHALTKARTFPSQDSSNQRNNWPRRISGRQSFLSSRGRQAGNESRMRDRHGSSFRPAHNVYLRLKLLRERFDQACAEAGLPIAGLAIRHAVSVV